MQIKFTGSYKSLTDFVSDELSDFTVITGKNGSGKSQLIHCIKDKRTQNREGEHKYQLKFIPNENNCLVGDLAYVSKGAASVESIRPILQQYQHQLLEIKPFILTFFSELHDKKKSLEDITLEDFEITSTGEKPETRLRYLLSKSGFSANQGFPISELFKRFEQVIKKYASLFDVLKEIATYKKKSFFEISENDFLTTPLLERYIDVADLINSQIETIFYAYLNRKRQNSFLNYLNEKENGKFDVLSSEEFDKKFIAPWNIINSILKIHFSGLEVEEYSLLDFSESAKIEIRFRKKGVPHGIQLSDLSSGEQIIVGLVLKLFTKEYYEGKLKVPKIFILDEPDAYLHPEMSKLLIEVLQDAFVKELGIKVIITTHSASTVALAPEESIFQMDNAYRNCSLKKISKDTALSLLTANIPTLSIDYKNHRQVFVESPTDIMYYQKVFNRLSSEERMSYKLYFISNEKGNSNSAWVADIVRHLRDGGVSKAYGILDWDCKNVSSNSTLVHGEKRRYSIENYILDPLYLSTLFIELDAHGIIQDLKINPLDNIYSLTDYSSDVLQKRSDWIVNKIQKKFPALETSLPSVVLNYYNGLKINIPEWYMCMKGHDLEEKIRHTFPAMTKFSDSVTLNEKLTVIIARSFPVVPLESIDLLKQLSN